MPLRPRSQLETVIALTETLFARRTEPDEAEVFHQSIVGESFYQATIAECQEEEPVALLAEPDNPHDANAVKVCRATGETIGHMARDSRIHRVFVEGKFLARIAKVTGGYGRKRYRGIVLKVMERGA
jgi:hypothetical protein